MLEPSLRHLKLISSSSHESHGNSPIFPLSKLHEFFFYFEGSCEHFHMLPVDQVDLRRNYFATTVIDIITPIWLLLAILLPNWFAIIFSFNSVLIRRIQMTVSFVWGLAVAYDWFSTNQSYERNETIHTQYGTKVSAVVALNILPFAQFKFPSSLLIKFC